MSWNTYTGNNELLTNARAANASATFRVTLTNITVVALLGLSILSVPASPGATWIHLTARAP